MKRPKVKTLKNKLDKLFSLMVRARDSEQPCISCGKRLQLQAGHFVKRSVFPTRWHPWNVNGECAGCNGFDGSHLIGYFISLEKRWGKGTAEKLFELSKVQWKVLPDQLERLILAVGDPADYESEWFAVQREFAPEFGAGDLEGATKCIDQGCECECVLAGFVECDDEGDIDDYDEDDGYFDCHMDRHGNCGKAGSEECDFECPYRDVKKN